LPTDYGPDWYPRYRELRNRADSGYALTPGEDAELADLQGQLQRESESLTNASVAARSLDASLGSRTVADALFSPPVDRKPPQDAPPPPSEGGPFFDPTGPDRHPWYDLPEVDPYEIHAAPRPETYDVLPPSERPSRGPEGVGPVPVPPGGGGGEGGREGPSEDRRGPWALETSTQSRLVEIRDAIRSLSKGSLGRQTGQTTGLGNGGEGEDDYVRSPLTQAALDALDLAVTPGAGRSRSGSNLAGFARGMRGTYYRTRESLRSVFKGAKPKTKAASSGAGTAGRAAAASGEAAAGAEASALAGAGAATAGLAVLAVAAFEAGKQSYALARAQEAEVRRLSEYGAQQAVGVAQLDANRVRRDIDTAQETGDSSRGLTKSLDAFEEKLRPIESLLTNIANTVGGRALDLIGQILAPISDGAKVINMIYDALPDFWKEDKAEDEVPFDRLRKLAEEMDRANFPRWPSGPSNAPVVGGPEPRRFP